jgi:hypothetical protein
MSDNFTTKPRPSTMRVSGFKTINAGAKRGFGDVTLPSGIVLHRCSIFVKDGRTRASAPSNQVKWRNCTVSMAADDRVINEQTVSLIDRATETRWSDQVIEALRIADPAALA